MLNILLIGIGNEFRSDDGIGILISRKIKQLNLPNIVVIEASGEGSELIELWKNQKFVIVVDAVNSGSKPGKIFKFDVTEQSLPIKFFNYSSHAFGLAEAVEVSRKLGELPERLLIYGIEGKNFSFGEKISEKVIEASDHVINLIIERIKIEQ
ncbi:MAG: hydrogenase maturation protease [Ignavibacteria bacterium]|nr:hydrogenase maturation protease [Ignavibacteria bacterium]